MHRKASVPSSRKSKQDVPSLRHHRPSGRAVVRLNGKDHYCGDWGTIAAKDAYDRLVSEWLANGRRLTGDVDLRVSELIDRYLDFAEGYYRRGDGTGEHEPIRRALIPLGEMFGRLRVKEFGPLKLKALRQHWQGLKPFRWGT